MPRGRRKDIKTLGKQVIDTLELKKGFGRSKHEDKRLGITKDYIYSYSTFKAYLKHSLYFIDWCRDNPNIKVKLGHKPRTLEECKSYVEEFIRYQEKRGLSAYTIKLEKSALEKLYGEKFCFNTKSTRRNDITRSRNAAKRDKNFSEENNRELVNACKHVGFRRFELEKCKPSDLVLKDGQYFVSIIGKGGRPRLAPVLDNDLATIQYIKGLTGKNKVHNGADVHAYRADYATSIYNKYKAADLNSLKGKKINYTELTGKRDKRGKIIYKSALYICRKDKAGVLMDRYAMIKASQSLGHNRENVVGEHYIRLE